MYVMSMGRAMYVYQGNVLPAPVEHWNRTLGVCCASGRCCSVYLKSEGTTFRRGREYDGELGQLMQAAGFPNEWGDWRNPRVSSENADLAVVV